VSAARTRALKAGYGSDVGDGWRQDLLSPSSLDGGGTVLGSLALVPSTRADCLMMYCDAARINWVGWVRFAHSSGRISSIKNFFLRSSKGLDGRALM